MGNALAKADNLNNYLRLPTVTQNLSEKLGLEEAKKFKAALSSAIGTNPVLALECDLGSVLNVALLGHSLNLPPSPQLGYYYFVPFNNRKRKCKEAQFVMGYKGYIQLAMRSGYYVKLNVSDVKAGEFVSWNSFTEDLEVNFITDPIKREKAETVGYCGFFEYKNGFRKITYWTLEAVQIHADKYSAAYSLEKDKLLKAGKIPQAELWKYSSFWYKDFDVMAKKTVIRNMLSRWGAMSVDMQTAFEKDLENESQAFEDAQVDASTSNKLKAGSETVAEFEEPKKGRWECENRHFFNRRKEGKACPECGSEQLVDHKPKTTATESTGGEDFLKPSEGE